MCQTIRPRKKATWKWTNHAAEMITREEYRISRCSRSDWYKLLVELTQLADAADVEQQRDGCGLEDC